MILKWNYHHTVLTQRRRTHCEKRRNWFHFSHTDIWERRWLSVKQWQLILKLNTVTTLSHLNRQYGLYLDLLNCPSLILSVLRAPVHVNFDALAAFEMIWLKMLKHTAVFEIELTFFKLIYQMWNKAYTISGHLLQTFQHKQFLFLKKI